VEVFFALSCYNTLMLNIFPELITFVLFAPLLLRVVVGSYFLYWGIEFLKKDRYADCATSLRVEWGSLGILFIWYLSFFEIIVGAFLITGFLTQAAAIGGMLIAGKLYYLQRTYPSVAKNERATYILIFVVCLSLLLSGAGVLAIDIPRL
jgi:uncharacterized membrane protein YphA (DoxX/SURF4 family)